MAGGIAGRSTVEGSGGTALYNVSGYLQMVRAPTPGPPGLCRQHVSHGHAIRHSHGAEWIGSGYQVAWKTGSNSYNFWTTDVSGKYVSQTGNLAGSSAQMQNYEYTFNRISTRRRYRYQQHAVRHPDRLQRRLSIPDVLRAGRQRWERIIRSDLPGVNSGTYGFIDDLRIDASVQFIDGTNGILAQAGWDLRRSSSDGGLPYHGIMRFDSSDINAMVNNGRFLSVVMHEMGHVLGLGTLWTLRPAKRILLHRDKCQQCLPPARWLRLCAARDHGGSGTAFATGRSEVRPGADDRLLRDRASHAAQHRHHRRPAGSRL